MTAQTPTSLAAMLHAIPGAQVRPPQQDDGRAWALVASFDAAFIERVRVAVQGARGETCLIAGEAPPPREYDPAGRGRYLWCEIRHGSRLSDYEPRRQMDYEQARRALPHCWIVEPAAVALPARSESGEFVDEW